MIGTAINIGALNLDGMVFGCESFSTNGQTVTINGAK
jgi:hypothetical protein